MPSNWREAARERVANALLEYEAGCLALGEPMEAKAFDKALREAYPFGEKVNHPYRIWCSECKLARRYFALVQSGKAEARFYGQWSLSQLGKRKPQPVVEGQLSFI
jgi:hypothetical protein